LRCLDIRYTWYTRHFPQEDPSSNMSIRLSRGWVHACRSKAELNGVVRMTLWQKVHDTELDGAHAQRLHERYPRLHTPLEVVSGTRMCSGARPELTGRRNARRLGQGAADACTDTRSSDVQDLGSRSRGGEGRKGRDERTRRQLTVRGQTDVSLGDAGEQGRWRDDASGDTSRVEVVHIDLNAERYLGIACAWAYATPELEILLGRRWEGLATEEVADVEWKAVREGDWLDGGSDRRSEPKNLADFVEAYVERMGGEGMILLPCDLEDEIVCNIQRRSTEKRGNEGDGTDVNGEESVLERDKADPQVEVPNNCNRYEDGSDVGPDVGLVTHDSADEGHDSKHIDQCLG